MCCLGGSRKPLRASMWAVRWVVTLEASRGDVEQLLAEAVGSLSATGDPLEVELELEDSKHDVATDEAMQAAGPSSRRSCDTSMALESCDGVGHSRASPSSRSRTTWEGVGAGHNVPYVDFA